MKRLLLFIPWIILLSCQKYESSAPLHDDFTIKPRKQYSDLPIIITPATISDGSYDRHFIYCDINEDGEWEANTETPYGLPIIYMATQNTKNLRIMEVNQDGVKSTKDYPIEVVTVNDTKFNYFIDSRDNQKYRTVKVGNQEWLAKNLNYNISGSLVYENNVKNSEVFGRLYNWQLASSVCPSGWHLPSDDEWKQLERNIGMSETDVNSAGYVSERGLSVGENLKVGGSSGINLLHAGAFSTTTWLSWDLNVFVDLFGEGYYWTSTDQGSGAITREISTGDAWTGIGRTGLAKTDCASVRCVKNSTINDIEGNTYQIIPIGSQLWMGENLKTTKFNDGNNIPLVADNTAWSGLSAPGYSWYNNDVSNKNTYGALYNWYTVNTNKLCPIGWHVPSQTEWMTLADYLGGLDIAGAKLKETGTTHWLSPNSNATNDFNFTALPGGFRAVEGPFVALRSLSDWWTSSAGSYSNTAWNIDIGYNTSIIRIYEEYVKYGLSVRCIKD